MTSMTTCPPDDDGDSELEREADDMLAVILTTEARRHIICRLLVRHRSGDIDDQDVDAILAVVWPNGESRRRVRGLFAHWRSVIEFD